MRAFFRSMLAVVAVMAAFIGATASAGFADPSQPKPAASKSASTDDLIWTTEPGKPADGVVKAAEVWAACGWKDAETKLVRAFSRYRMTAANNNQYLAGGTSNLLCGNDSYGYRHIQKNHQTEWEQMGFATNQNWRDVADYAIATTLSSPDRGTYRTTTQIMCFQRQILLVNKSTGQTVGTKTILVGVRYYSPNNIITAYPGTACT